MQNNPSVPGSLRYELNRKITSGKIYEQVYNRVGINDEEIVEVPLDLPLSGFYLVQAWVSPCAASEAAKESPFFTCQILNNDTALTIGSRKTVSINIAKVWDYDNVITFTVYASQGSIKAVFTSYMGRQLSTQYGSNFGIRFIKL